MIYLVSCTARKASKMAAARDLYTSTWFRLARAYVESRGAWYILSARYGLLSPEELVEPYDLSLHELDWHQKASWSLCVAFHLRPLVTPGDTVVLLAGETYRNALRTTLKVRLGLQVKEPLRGLRIGEQLRWFKRRTAS